jgi:hypothetical protein
VLQRERHGTLLMDHTRTLDLYLRALWRDGDVLVPYSTTFDVQRQPMPYFDALGMRLPDVYDARAGITGWTVTAPRWRTWRRTGAGAHPSLPTTSARRSAWPLSALKTLAWTYSPCVNTPACGGFFRLCIPHPRKARAIRPPIPACGIGWPAVTCVAGPAIRFEKPQLAEWVEALPRATGQRHIQHHRDGLDWL